MILSKESGSETIIAKTAFRIVTSADWDKFREIRLKGLKSDPHAFGGSFQEEIEREEIEWRKRLDKTDRFFFVAEENGVFVSVAGARQTADKKWMLVAVHTLPEARGRGLAQELAMLVTEEAKRRGADTIELMVNVDQKDAVHIYEKAGFKIAKMLKDQMMGDGKLHDEYHMDKILDKYFNG